MKYNIEIDSHTAFVIRYSLSHRIEFIKRELNNAKEYKAENSVKYWEGELDVVKNAVDTLIKNSRLI